MSKIVIDARELRTSTGRYVERLLHYLQKIDNSNNYTVLLKPQDFEGWTPTNKKFHKLESPYKEFTWSEQIDLLRQIKKLEPDLVHFAMTQQPVLYRGRVVTTIHDLTTARFRNPAKNWLVFTVKRWVYRWVTRYVAHKSIFVMTDTEYVKDDLARFANLNSRKITVTYLAADKITEPAEALEDFPEGNFIFYVGRSLPHKNLKRLLEAFQIAQAKHPDLNLVLAGKRDKTFLALKALATLRGIKNVHFTGFISEANLRWLYENAQAYVFPSLSEGFGLPGLEAMIHGCPLISSNATCLPEVYGAAAVYFDPLSVEDMAETIDKVLGSEKLRKEMVSKGRKQADKYSWQRMAEQTLEVYKEALL